MTQAHELNILLLETIAALLMGFDVFVGTPFRGRLETLLRAYVSRVKDRVDADIVATTTRFKRKAPLLIWAVVAGVASVTCNRFLASVSDDFSPVLGEAVLVISMVALAYFWYCVQVVLLQSLLEYGVSIPFRAVTAVALFSPKGQVAMIGFLCLLASFFVRYGYITGD